MKKILIIVGSIILVVIVAMYAFRSYTMSHSPLEVVSVDGTMEIKYCRPFKKERMIFGNPTGEGEVQPLVPYGEVWRTGANEATLVSVEKTLYLDGNEVMPGQYSLWTIPNEDSWEVILNSETGQWGVNFDGVANRNPEFDVASVTADVVQSKKEFEQFTIVLHPISEGEIEMALMWDRTLVVVPITLTSE